MNQEIEIKVKIKNPEPTEQILQSKTKFIKAKNQKDEYFVPKHKDFFSFKPATEFLRVRHEQDKDSLDYHLCHFAEDGSLLKSDEYEVGIDNPEMMSIILKKLDMIKKITVTKHRKCFKYQDFEIVLDYIEELGYFLEVEIINFSDSESLESANQRCYDVLKQLNIEYEKTTNIGYPSMILEKNAQMSSK